MAPVLVFTLSEEGASALRDVLVCLNKFNEEVCLEAKKDQVCRVSGLREVLYGVIRGPRQPSSLLYSRPQKYNVDGAKLMNVTSLSLRR
jgi:hypothetical protein